MGSHSKLLVRIIALATLGLLALILLFGSSPQAQAGPPTGSPALPQDSAPSTSGPIDLVPQFNFESYTSCGGGGYARFNITTLNTYTTTVPVTTTMRFYGPYGTSMDTQVPPFTGSYTYQFSCGESMPCPGPQGSVFTLTVDINNVVVETDETNNTLSQSLYGPPTSTPCPPSPTPPPPTATSTPTPTGIAQCSISQSGSSTQCNPPSSYDYRVDFSAASCANYGFTGTATFQVSETQGGTYVDYDQQPVSGNVQSTFSIEGTFAEPNIPSQYHWYKVVIEACIDGIHCFGGQTSPTTLCPPTTPTPTSSTPTNSPLTPVPTITFLPPSDTPTNTPTVTPTASCPTWQMGPSHTPGRYGVQGAVANNDLFYVAGGLDAEDNVIGDFSYFFFNSWTSLGTMPSPAGRVSVGASGDKVYVAGGFTGSGITSTLRIYNTTSNTWSFGAPMPAAVEAAAGAVLNGKFFVLGGDNLTNVLTTNYIYDIASNTWSTAAPLPQPRGNVNATSFNSRIFLYGGIDGSFAATNTMFDYEPVSNVWTSHTPNPYAANEGNYAAITTYESMLVITGGGDSNNVPNNLTFYFDGATWSRGPNLSVARMGHATGTCACGDDNVIVYSGLTSTQPNEVTTSTEILPPRYICTTPTPPPPPITATPTALLTATPTARPTAPPSATPTACVMNFVDVHESDWFYDYVKWMYCNNIITGYHTVPPCGQPGENCFKPNNSSTRAQISKMVVLGFQVPIDTTGGPHFQDVPVGSTFYEFVETLYNKGAVNGYPCGGGLYPCIPPRNLPYFLPNVIVTRGQLTKIVILGASIPINTTAGPHFEDVPVGSVFYPYVETLFNLGSIHGYPCGGAGEPCDPVARAYFRPNNNVTRAQLSKIIYLSQPPYPGKGSSRQANRPPLFEAACLPKTPLILLREPIDMRA